MMKKIAVACLGIVLGSSLNAAEGSSVKPFLGLEGGYSQVQGAILPVSNGTYSQKTGEDGIYGLRIGAQDEEWRAALIFNSYDNTETDQNVEQFLLAVDYMFLGGQYSATTTFAPYIGLNVGYANYESTFVESDGLIYGAQAGFVVSATENIDLDLGYRYSLSDTEELDHIGSFIFAVNYLY